MTLDPRFVEAFGKIFKTRQGQTVNNYNDAHEALMCMCVWLQTEEDPFDKVLRRTVTSTAQCNTCKTQSSRQEPVSVVLLTIPKDLLQRTSTTIQEIYDWDLRERPLPDYDCLVCKCRQPAVVKVTYESNPSGLLVLYLSRHYVFHTTGRIRKHSKPVVSSRITHAGSDYVLVAVACHKDKHYFAYVTRWENWHDERGNSKCGNVLYRVEDAQVASTKLDKTTLTEMWTYCYLLFYARRSFFDLKMK